MTTVDQIHNVINIYSHDHRTGLFRGIPGTLLAMIEQPQCSNSGIGNGNGTVETEVLTNCPCIGGVGIGAGIGGQMLPQFAGTYF